MIFLVGPVHGYEIENLSGLHDRMPVILPEEHIDIWLDRSVREEKKLLPLLKPYPAEEMECYEVPRLVNSPENDSPEVISRV